MNALNPDIRAEVVGEVSIVWDGERASLAKALVAAQKATESIKKAATNPAFKSRYADLAHVVEGVVPALNDNGVAVIQFPGFDGDMVSVTTTFLHESGASVTSILHLRPSKVDPQGIGSAVTYGRRYSLLAMSGAAPEDDDGAASSGPRQRPAADKPDFASGEKLAINLLRACGSRELFKSAWEKNKDAWRKALDEDTYVRVVAEMKRIAAEWKAREEAETPPDGVEPKANADDFGIREDEIPY